MPSANSAPGHKERRILLAMSEPDAAALVEQALVFHGFAVTRAASGEETLAAMRSDSGESPDLVLVDLAQPDMDGLILCVDLREKTAAPIIVCGTQDGRRESLLAFRLGADDFVAKPLDVDDLVARAEAALRRVGSSSTRPLDGVEAGAGRGVEPERMTSRGSAGTTDGLVRAGDLALDQTHHRVMVGGQEVKLSRSEYLLLAALMSRPDELLSRLDLARAVWGEQLARVGRPIDQHMYRLRAKLQSAASAAGVPAPVIVSVPGFGYRLVGNAEEQRVAA